MMTLEILGAIAASITIFTAGVAVGRYIEHSKNDRRQCRDYGGRFLTIHFIRANRLPVAPLYLYYSSFKAIVKSSRLSLYRQLTVTTHSFLTPPVSV